jgi:hypothetical protein
MWAVPSLPIIQIAGSDSWGAEVEVKAALTPEWQFRLVVSFNFTG